MPDYVRGTVLGTATTLPLTAASAFLITNRAHIWVIVGFLLVNALSLTLTLAMVTRYIINRQRQV